VSRVVLVLSGGGAKALAHAGAFRALEQAALVPSHIVATSMGAVVGAALGAGMPFRSGAPPRDGIRRKDVAPFDPLVLIMASLRAACFRRPPCGAPIARIVPKTRFEYLRIPLTVTATDLDSRRAPVARRTGAGAVGNRVIGCVVRLLRAALYFPPLEAEAATGGERRSPCRVCRSLPRSRRAQCRSVRPGARRTPRYR